jgi:sec-independent protein translocase protein TatB
VLNLSPLKILIVLVVTLLVVGPDRLPQIARQLGGAWKALRSFSTKVEEEVRSNMPDLPSTGDLARFARSPVALLDKLAGLDEKGLTKDRSQDVADAGDELVPDPGAPRPEEAPSPRRPPPAASGFDPSLN